MDAVAESEQRHEHCDSDPIECWVEAIQGEFEARGERIERLKEALRGSEEARLLTEQKLAQAQAALEVVGRIEETETT